MKQLLALGVAFACHIPLTAAAENPNILWIIAEDMSPDLGCYGNTTVTTPHIDDLAARGMRFDRAFVTGPACSPSRTSLATGVYQTSLGACNMRYTVPLADGIRILPELMRDNGYYTGNLSEVCGTGTAKDDWLFTTSQKQWDTDSWDDLIKHQPFYGQIDFSESHRGFRRDSRQKIDPQEVTLPPYYPDHPVSRHDWAGYLMEVNRADEHLGKILAQLEKDGLAGNTIVVFFSDHGRPMTRCKNWLYDSGTRIPLIICYPPQAEKPTRYKAGGASSNLISGVDLVAETLVMAGCTIPDWMQGQSFLRGDSTPREYVATAADVFGNIETCSRAVRTQDYKYIRNFKRPGSINACSTPYRQAQHPIHHLLNVMGERGLLTDVQARLLEPLAEEELYDLNLDPHETVNLIGHPEYATIHHQLKSTLEGWMTDTKDIGVDSVDDELRKAIKAYGSTNLKKLGRRIRGLRVEVESNFEDSA